MLSLRSRGTSGSDLHRKSGQYACQINLNGCRAAQDLMLHTSVKRNTVVVIIYEQHREGQRCWYAGAGCRCAIHILYLTLENEVGVVDGEGFVWVEVGRIRLYSCYYSPNSPIDAFEHDISQLAEDMESSRLPIVVTVNFNCKAPEWGSSTTDRRGVLLTETTSRLNLHVGNR